MRESGGATALTLYVQKWGWEGWGTTMDAKKNSGVQYVNL